MPFRGSFQGVSPGLFRFFEAVLYPARNGYFFISFFQFFVIYLVNKEKECYTIVNLN